MVKTWTVMYGLIWASFAQIFLIVFLLSVVPSTGFLYDLTIDLHIVVGIAVIFLAMRSPAFTCIRSACP